MGWEGIMAKVLVDSRGIGSFGLLDFGIGKSKEEDMEEDLVESSKCNIGVVQVGNIWFDEGDMG